MAAMASIGKLRAAKHTADNFLFMFCLGKPIKRVITGIATLRMIVTVCYRVMTDALHCRMEIRGGRTRCAYF